LERRKTARKGLVHNIRREENQGEGKDISGRGIGSLSVTVDIVVCRKRKNSATGRAGAAEKGLGSRVWGTKLGYFMRELKTKGVKGIFNGKW